MMSIRHVIILLVWVLSILNHHRILASPAGERQNMMGSERGATALKVENVREKVMTVEISVQIVVDVARVLHQQAPPTSGSQKLTQVLQELGVALEPVHPGMQEPELIKWFTINVPDRVTAERVVTRLLEGDMVEAAYVKPPAEPAQSP